MGVEADSYFRAVAKRADEAGDPVVIAQILNEEIAAMSDVLRDLGSLRAEAVRNARHTMSVQDIANGLGVTRARVYQILDA